MDSVTDLTERLRKLLADATPGDLATAERHTENETVECPLCHEGEVEASDYCNIDGKALGVQFYGIGKEFGAHERLWSETLAALPNLLTTLENLTQENARLREALEKAADEFTMVIYRLDNGEPERALGAAQCGGRGSRKALGGGDDAN